MFGLVCICLTVLYACVEGVNDYFGASSAKCGDSLHWNYEPTKQTLTINGTGDMSSFSNSTAVPWNSLRSSIKAVVLEDGVASVGSYAFWNCTNLLSVTLPSGLWKIENNAFGYCTSLQSIKLPGTVTYFLSNAFIGCSSLLSVTVGTGPSNYLKDIDGVVFYAQISSLVLYPAGRRQSSYVIPNSVSDIWSYAFYGCSYLKSVTIPDSVSEIYSHAFDSCTSLTTVTIPSSVNYIGDGPFVSCSSLTRIEVDTKNEYYKSEDGVLIYIEDQKLIQYPNGRKGSYTIPADVTAIGMESFSNATGLTSITIHANVSSIEKNAFASCDNLEIISYLGTSKPSMTDDSFENCEHIRVICVPFEYRSKEMIKGAGICKRDRCDELEDVENHCYYTICEGMNWSSMKRTNASMWENRTNGCVEYECNNESGLVSRSKCTSKQNVCKDNECLVNETDPDARWKVNITIENGDDNDETIAVDTERIIETFSQVTGVNSDELVVVVEMDDNGRIVNVIVYLDDYVSQQKIEDAVKLCAS